MNRNEAITEEALKKLYVEKKMSTIQVAVELGASDAAVYQALKRYGLPVRTRSVASRVRWGHTWDVDWAALAKRYDQGATLEELAEEVGCSWAPASAHLSKYTKIRPRGSEVKPNSRGRIDIDVSAAIEANQKGATLTEIASRMGVSVQIVSKRLREAGYTVKTNKASTEKFANLQARKRKVAKAIDASKCRICRETRGVQLCHIQPRRKGGPLNPDNAVALCPSHHWFFDRGELTEDELARIKPTLREAAGKGYVHPLYSKEGDR